MRLTYITTSALPSPKASSVQVVQMCAAFAGAGALVKLVSRQSAASVDVFDHYGLPRNFAFAPRPFPRGPRPADVFQVRAVLAERNADWLCYARGRDLTAPLLALWRGAQAIVEVHGRPLTLRERVMLTLIARHPRGRLIAISDPLRDVYRREFGLPTFVAGDGVDLARFDPAIPADSARAALKLQPGRWVAYVGGLYRGRGIETLLAAAAGLPMNVLVVGGRDEAEVAEWRERARQAGVVNARFEGYQPPARVPLYLFAADVLAMPYGARTLTPSGEDTTAWMSPLKLYEYMAAGRPIVATDLPALRRVLTHGHNALLVPPDDSAALRAALEHLAAQPALAGHLAANARADAAQHTWLRRAEKILETLNDRYLKD